MHSSDRLIPVDPGRQVGLEVNAEPLAARPFRVMSRSPDHLGADTSVLPAAACLGVEQERVVGTVPGDVHESCCACLRVASSSAAAA
jgi:hypothetical protein